MENQKPFYKVKNRKINYLWFSFTKFSHLITVFTLILSVGFEWMKNWTELVEKKIYVYLFNSLRYIAANLKTWRNTMDKRIHGNTQLDFWTSLQLDLLQVDLS